VISLVLNGDDLGLTRTQSSVIGDLLQEGHLTDASLLTTGDAFPEAIVALSRSRVATIGLHLSLVGGDIPVLPPRSIPSLVRNGRFRMLWPSVVSAALAGRIRLRDAEAEWEAQVERTLSSRLRISHLDSHQHLHLLPFFFPVALRLATRYGIPFVRAPKGFGRGGKEALLGLFAGSARRHIERAGLPPPPPMIGLNDAGRMSLDRFERLLESLPEGTYEVALHPGAENAEMAERYPWGYLWEEETRLLRSEELRGLFQRFGVRATSFADLALRGNQ
jgi:predicted glycoside hydrolase/deacetylase ChbG (UPF0249 family)